VWNLLGQAALVPSYRPTDEHIRGPFSGWTPEIGEFCLASALLAVRHNSDEDCSLLNSRDDLCRE